MLCACMSLNKTVDLKCVCIHVLYRFKWLYIVVWYCFLIDPAEKVHPYVFITYKFNKVPEHTILVSQYRNYKENKPYRWTVESTKKLLSTKLESQSPKMVVNSVHESMGGIINAESAGKLPRNRDQVYYLKKKINTKKSVILLGQGCHKVSMTCYV